MNRRGNKRMHRLRSRGAVGRFKLASWMLLLQWILVPAGIVLFVHSRIADDGRSALVAAACIAGILPITLFHWMIAMNARCPICLSPPMAHRSCSLHSHAKRLFGSYRLHVAWTVMLSKRFRCPYCGEMTAVRVPDR